MEQVAIFSRMGQISFSFMYKQRGPIKYSEEDYMRWVDLYKEGKSFREIAEVCDVPFATIAWRVRKKLGITDGRTCGRKKKYHGLSNADVQRQWQLKDHYGLSLVEREEMEKAQGGVCAICGDPPRGGKTAWARLNVDHDHKGGKVRALLCADCNHGIGKLKDNPILLEKAAAYIRAHQEAS